MSSNKRARQVDFDLNFEPANIISETPRSHIKFSSDMPSRMSSTTLPYRSKRSRPRKFVKNYTKKPRIAYDIYRAALKADNVRRASINTGDVETVKKITQEFSNMNDYNEWKDRGRPGMWRGRGAYNFGNFIEDMQKAEPLANRFITKGIPNLLGAATGIKSFFGGSGAYDHTSNQLINPSGPSRHMSSSPDETNDITIIHSEFLQDLTPTSTSFQTLYATHINPGLSADVFDGIEYHAFPWLSQIAQYYEEYEFEQLMYTVKSMVTEGNSTAQGSIIHATQYNPSNDLFTSKISMENYEYANSHKVTDHGQHGIECDPMKKSGNASEYVRTGSVPIGQDIKTFDLGIFQIAANNCAANLSIGELWVSYKIKLKKAKIPQIGTTALPPSIPYWRFTISQNLATQIFNNTNVTVANGAGITTELVPTTGKNFNGATGQFLLFNNRVNQGYYKIILTFDAATSSVSGLTATANFQRNCQSSPDDTAITQALTVTTLGTATTQVGAVMTFRVFITGPGPQVSFTGVTGCPTSGNLTVDIIRMA